MEKIYSKVEPKKLLHVVVRFNAIKGRTQLIPDDNFIQCSSLKMEKGKTKPSKVVVRLDANKKKASKNPNLGK